ncbi:ankyrin repeat, SAM and basic leucine zipper domain-containing protein 1-like [Physella acuta]|uniref:ankyrin repeat, SAM and basic leucine zipper domain-containing protein 1-like n=1 Tax=Physella acuta TaxID=109671 RepID=UPI0027DE705B|nr:ankyrin repeat, SAM and basic leucine zipper domain-containing protein 1-like [Physella acuta]
MSCVPAEEDDYDSEDGYFDNDDYSYDINKRNMTLNSPTTATTTSTTQVDEVNKDIHIGQKNGNQNGNQNINKQDHFHNFKSQEKTFVPVHTKHVNIVRQREVSASHNGKNLSRPFYSNIFSMEDLKTGVVKGDLELVEKCLNQALPINEPYKSGWSALMYAANYAHPKVVQCLLDRGADPKFHHDMFTPLMAACSSSYSENLDDVTECVKILLATGADINAKDRLHATPLMLASREGHHAVVKELIKSGADINKQDTRGWTALTWAAQRGRAAVVIELLESGANPNIQHHDKLTVKDLAANLPTNEILSLLEHGSKSVTNAAGDSGKDQAKNSTTPTTKTFDCGDELHQSKFTDLRYGELEVFLLGLELPHLISVFQEQLIDLNLLMTLTEDDLIKAGVEQVGARKKILDAVQAVHKKDWEPSSLVSIHYNKKINCADAVAMMANTSKHLRYIGSTVVYVREHLKKHPDTVTLPTDRVSPSQLKRHVVDTLKNVEALRSQLASLQSELTQEMKKRKLDPPDLVEKPTLKRSKTQKIIIASVVLVSSCVAVYIWHSRETLISFIPSKINSLLNFNIKT